jgi:hypothetical protein
LLVSELACLGENHLLALMAILQLRRVALRSSLGAGMDHLRVHGPLGGVERPGRMVRFARLMQRRVRALDGPQVRAAYGGNRSLT